MTVEYIKKPDDYETETSDSLEDYCNKDTVLVLRAK